MFLSAQRSTYLLLFSGHVMCHMGKQACVCLLDLGSFDSRLCVPFIRQTLELFADSEIKQQLIKTLTIPLKTHCIYCMITPSLASEE